MKFTPRQRQALDLVAAGKFIPAFVREEDGWHARWRSLDPADESADGWVDEYVRGFTMSRLTEDAEDDRHETLHDAWIAALRSRTGLVRWDDAECAAFAAELEVWGGNAAEDRAERQRIVFRLQAPASGSAASFQLTCDVPKGRGGLRALGQAACVWPPLGGMRRAVPTGRRPFFLQVLLTRAEAEDFLHHGSRDLRDAGYRVEGADLAASVTATAEIDTPDAQFSDSSDIRSASFHLIVRVAGERVTAEEIRFLLEQDSSLVFFRNRWIEVDRSILKQALRALEKGAGKKANVLSFALGLGHVGSLEVEEVESHGGLRALVGALRANGVGRLGEDAAIAGFAGSLRDYQRRGVEWLAFLTDHGFGALLADDMGLGKTVQVIAWTLLKPGRKVLVVAPLTLLSNWRHEFARFAPGLKVYVHQGEMRHVASGFARAVAEADVTVTSYNLLVRDYGEISSAAWDALVLDEAQAIKNPDTQVARAVCALRPAQRIALTGTPVENTVADLWSIEEFLNPGFLGERRAFEERFARPIAADELCSAGRRLRRALEPFVLRRLKTDERIASELGEKREVREYCEITAEERRAYETALAEFRATEHARGDVFALLTRLKLICDGMGKFERLCELVGSIFDAGESALVFTQYAKVGAWLQRALAERFGRRFPFLHGALSAAERERQVRAFQASSRPNLFLLSLKAGGFGLNLTKATHVIHFDRWWNPAVESQATDRAHRIGQTKAVLVHLFIAAGTLEEHVDDILRRKSRVAGAVITEAEWLEAAELDMQN